MADRNTAADRYTPAQMYSLAFGATLLLIGILGVIANSTFNTGAGVNGNDILGLFPVNAADNVLHLLISGAGIAAGLASADRRRVHARAASQA